MIVTRIERVPAGTANVAVRGSRFDTLARSAGVTGPSVVTGTPASTGVALTVAASSCAE